MEKIKLDIADIAPSGSTSGAYALVLTEESGARRLPIVIGGHEAQAIAIELENMTPSRPLTHDLFKSFAHSFGVTVEEVIIYNLIEGIFFAKVIAVLDGRRAEIDSRTSDAVAIAVRFKCPIYCYDFILDSAGVNAEEIEESYQIEEEPSEGAAPEAPVESAGSMTIQELEAELANAIDREDYERASILRDEIEKRKREG
ncbi:bifunctional nuclease family protein [Sanyastnella coralliicola]|uniref:bifunctional nuclease family protein n=1 Tax=Sanyastnella coralliicola TaxID=3069118 RepID=UPI0027B95B89|nr:bifunctional nuclease family protein [Longitalea sp. SCSIO 12813]